MGPGVPGSVKTRLSQGRAELFSLFSSFDCACQSGYFAIQRNRDKRSTRKLEVGVFTQPGARGPITPGARNNKRHPLQLTHRHHPRKRVIQYSRAFLFIISGGPVEPGDDDEIRVLVLATHCARGLQNHSPPEERGRREDRVRAAPAVSCAMCIKRNAHEHTGEAEAVRPCAMVYGLLRALPGDRLSCHRHQRIAPPT